MDFTSATDTIDSENTVFEFDVRLLKIFQSLKNKDLLRLSRTISKKDVRNIVADGLLHQAVSHGNEWMTRHLIELGGNVDSKVNGVTPLMIAIQKENKELVDILLEATTDVNITDHVRIRNALQMMPDLPIYPNYCAMNIILHNVKRKMSTLEKFTEKVIAVGCSVFEATLLGNIEVVKYMLERGLDVNCKGHNFTTALHVAIFFDNLKMVEFLLENGADIKALDNNGNEALFDGIHYGKYNGVEMLLQRGANPNAVNNRMPILLWSIIRADYIPEKNWTKPKEKTRLAENVNKCIELLLQHGANPQILCSSRRSIFQVIHYIDKDCKKDGEEDANNIASLNLVIAHLAMLKMLGKPILKRTRIGINLDLRYKKYYQLCQRILKATIFKSMTLFELLTEDDDKMKIHMRNKKFISKLLCISHKYELAVVYPYYFNIIKKRISRITRDMRLKYFAAKAISDISNYNMSYMITEKIVAYLDQQSLEKLAASSEVDKLLKRSTSVKTM